MKILARNYYKILMSFIMFFMSCGGSSADSGKDKCVMLPCHGLDLQCVLQSEELACTQIYMLGDNCRRYAKCQQHNDGCSLVTDPAFERCKNCVQKCDPAHLHNPSAAFDCEAKCFTQ